MQAHFEGEKGSWLEFIRPEAYPVLKTRKTNKEKRRKGRGRQRRRGGNFFK